MRLYRGLLGEIIVMALDTLRLNKLRSALTVLGVVIGITAIVGMTSLIRGFDQSLRDSIRTLGPDTIFIAQFSGVSLASGRDVEELLKRPSLTIADARAIEQQASAIRLVDIMLGGAGGPDRGSGVRSGCSTKTNARHRCRLSGQRKTIQTCSFSKWRPAVSLPRPRSSIDGR
jgi:hypothetical protein